LSDVCLLHSGADAARGNSRVSRTSSVLAALRDDITAGVFEPGERLTEDRLSAQYQVSRVPVREALKVLETRGFLQLEPHKGATVRTLTLADAADLYSIREVVESRAARRAASRRTPAQADFLRDVVARGQRANEDGATAALQALNSALHLGIVDAAHSRTLRRMLDGVTARVHWLYTRQPLPPDLVQRGDTSWDEHDRIVSAIVEGDGDRAEHEMTLHLHAMRSSLIARHHGDPAAPIGHAG
jgi:DNA-binding GntR family transcriptional regulator